MKNCLCCFCIQIAFSFSIEPFIPTFADNLVFPIGKSYSFEINTIVITCIFHHFQYFLSQEHQIRSLSLIWFFSINYLLSFLPLRWMVIALWKLIFYLRNIYILYKNSVLLHSWNVSLSYNTRICIYDIVSECYQLTENFRNKLYFLILTENFRNKLYFLILKIFWLIHVSISVSWFEVSRGARKPLWKCCKICYIQLSNT